MTTRFMDDDFLLRTATAQRLYHEYASGLPIIDYHCHLVPQEIAANRPFANLTELWLGADHYKWRYMRSAGVSEDYITGKQDDYAKFLKYCSVLPLGAGNPLHHWSHLELKRYFGLDLDINEDNAEAIWHACNTQLARPESLPRALIRRSGVAAVCTTDDPADDLSHHATLRAEGFATQVLPTFRPDVYLAPDRPGFALAVARLANASGRLVESYRDLLLALEARVDYFAAHGCVVADHGLDGGVFYASASATELEDITHKALSARPITALELDQFRTGVFLHLGRLYAQRGWAMQVHIGAQRANNTRMTDAIGINTGFDSISDQPVSVPLARLLDALDVDGLLPKTILYCLNPIQNEVLGTMIGNFQDGSRAGKVQFGAAWWFNDHKDGMVRQLTALASLGCLGGFVGMLTDSRSFISYPRHEYFRRILCNLLGSWVDEGEYPRDWKRLKLLVENICFGNANRYFELNCPQTITP